MDDADRADAEMEALLTAGLSRRSPSLVPCMHCHNCSDDVAEGVLFCSSECRDDHEKRSAAARRAGRG